jgi:hypothetical protein
MNVSEKVTLVGFLTALELESAVSTGVGGVVSATFTTWGNGTAENIQIHVSYFNDKCKKKPVQ